VKNFRPGGVNYEEQSESYAAARSLSQRAVEAWGEAITRWLAPLQPSLVLDLGSGTGRFSPLIASRLGCGVVGVEPSDGMRETAMKEATHPRVRYVAGDALNIPLDDGSCDAAWLGYMVHHVPDRVRCAQELSRLLRAGAIVLVAGACTEKRKEISLFRYFPAALRIVDQFPLETEISASFAEGGLEHVATESVVIESAPSLAVAATRTALRADTTLRLISDEEYAEGQRALEEAAAREAEPQPILDSIDLLVYRRS
jgi:SAM-dependent methyltransferase